MKRLTECPKCSKPLSELAESVSRGCGTNCRAATVLFVRRSTEVGVKAVSEELTNAAVAIRRARGLMVAARRLNSRVGDQAFGLRGGPLDFEAISEHLDQIADFLKVAKRELEVEPPTTEGADA